MNFTHIIIFLRESETDSSQMFGFKLFEKAEAQQYIKAVKILANNECSFDAEFSSIMYVTSDFSMMKLSANDLKFLSKIFAVNEDNDHIGIFPDAINDAYENGLLEEEEDDEEE